MGEESGIDVDSAEAIKALLEQTEEGNPLRKVVRDLEAANKAKAKKLDDLGEEVTELKGQTEQSRLTGIFSEIGVPDEGPGKLFREKDWSDKDAEEIKAAAQEYGIIDGGGPDQEQSQQVIDSASQINETVGQQPESGPTVEQLLQEASTPEEIQAVMANAGLTAEQ